MPVSQKARDNYDAFAYCRDRGHLDFLEKDEKCGRFFSGLQWDEKVQRRLARQGRPAMTINKTLATINTVLGEQLQNRADVSFLPFKNGNEETAEALSKVHLQILQANNYRWIESEIFADGVIGSRGCVDCRISFKDNLMGEVELSLLNPRNVVIDPDATSYDPADWKQVFITKWMTCDEIELLYGKSDASILRQRDQSQLELGYDSIDSTEESFGGDFRRHAYDEKHRIKRVRVIERQFKELAKTRQFVDIRTGEARTIPEDWDDERIGLVLQNYPVTVIERPIERIRWRVSADDVLLFDELSPMRYFTPVFYFPYFRRGKTIGLVESLISPQEILNKSASQMLHVLNSSANGGWKVKANALKNMTIEELETRGAQTGLVLELDDIANADKIQPNQIPSGLDRMTFLTDEFIKEISGVSDSLRGFDREDVAARAIQAKQAAGSVNLSAPFENLVRTRQLLATRILNLIQIYYTEERVLQITQEGAAPQTEQLTVNQVTPEGTVANDLTVGEYQVVVTSVPTRESYMASQYEQALAMREQGVMIPDQVLIEASNLAKKTQILQMMNDDGTKQREQQKADLELQDLQAEVATKQADAERKKAETALAASRAGKTDVDAQVALNGGAGQPDPMAELELEKYKIDQQMMLEKYKFEQELKLKEQQMQQELLMKRAEAELRMELEERNAAMQNQFQAEQIATKSALDQQSAQAKHQLANQQFEADNDLANRQFEAQSKLQEQQAKAKAKAASQAPKPRR